MNFNTESLKKLKRIHLVYSYSNSYLYGYSTSVNLFNDRMNSYIETAFLACRRNQLTKYVNELFDFSEFINNAINKNMSVKDCTKYLGVVGQASTAKIIDMTTCSLEQIQSIIDANTAALTRLNSYIQECKTIKYIESM